MKFLKKNKTYYKIKENATPDELKRRDLLHALQYIVTFTVFYLLIVILGGTEYKGSKAYVYIPVILTFGYIYFLRIKHDIKILNRIDALKEKKDEDQ